MKPGVDDARTGVLPQASAVAYSISATSEDVASPVTISTSGIRGAGLKKMHPGDAFRPRAAAAERRDRERRRVRCQDAFRRNNVLERRQELALGREVFDDGLDDKLRHTRVRERHDGRDPADRRIGVRLYELALRDELGEGGGDVLLGRVARAEARVVELDAMAVHRGDLGNARAHRAGADDGDGRARRQRRDHLNSVRARPPEAHCAPPRGAANTRPKAEGQPKAGPAKRDAAQPHTVSVGVVQPRARPPEAHCAPPRGAANTRPKAEGQPKAGPRIGMRRSRTQ